MQQAVVSQTRRTLVHIPEKAIRYLCVLRLSGRSPGTLVWYRDHLRIILSRQRLIWSGHLRRVDQPRRNLGSSIPETWRPACPFAMHGDAGPSGEDQTDQDPRSLMHKTNEALHKHLLNRYDACADRLGQFGPGDDRFSRIGRVYPTVIVQYSNASARGRVTQR
jgi:hypothetical protein